MFKIQKSSHSIKIVFGGKCNATLIIISYTRKKRKNNGVTFKVRKDNRSFLIRVGGFVYERRRPFFSPLYDQSVSTCLKNYYLGSKNVVSLNFTYQRALRGWTFETHESKLMSTTRKSGLMRFSPLELSASYQWLLRIRNEAEAKLFSSLSHE